MGRFVSSLVTTGVGACSDEGNGSGVLVALFLIE